MTARTALSRWARFAAGPEWRSSPRRYVIGVDRVGIGTGTPLLSSRVGQGTNKAWPGLAGGFFYAAAGEIGDPARGASTRSQPQTSG